MDWTTIHGHDFLHCSHMRLESPMMFVIRHDLFNWTILWMLVNYIIIKTNGRDCVREAVGTVNDTWTLHFHCVGSHSCVRLVSPWWLPRNDARTRHIYIPDYDFTILKHDNIFDSILLLSLNDVIQLIIIARLKGLDLFSDLTFPCLVLVTGCGRITALNLTKLFTYEIQDNLDLSNNPNLTYKFKIDYRIPDYIITINVISLNVLKHRQQQLSKLIFEQHLDIICLQEIHDFSNEQIHNLEKQLSCTFLFWYQ